MTENNLVGRVRQRLAETWSGDLVGIVRDEQSGAAVIARRRGTGRPRARCGG
jgi:hypothetical protein